MASIYLFDVDGTLTPPKARVDDSFKSLFLKWMKNKEVYIVSGGSFVRIIDQLGDEIVNKTEGVFACMGNIFYRQVENINPTGFNEWQIVYENKFKAPAGLYRDLDTIVHNSHYDAKTQNHYEARTGMVNFSIVGRDATESQRKDYADYDAEEFERAHIVEDLKEKYPKLDFVIGGAVSIDIFNIGNDKSQVIDRHLEEALEHNRVHFVGDRIPFPGNDYSIAVALQQHPNGATYEVENWKDTAKLLKTEPFA